MLFPALSATTAMWLLTSPLFGLEMGSRATLAVAAGGVALVLAALSLYSPRASKGLVAIGALLTLVNFLNPETLGPLANYATCAVGLMVGGAAPYPRAVPAHAISHATAPAMATAKATARKDAAVVDSASDGDTRRIVGAAA